MKKHFSFTILSLFIIFISACSTNDEIKENTMQEADLSNHEKVLARLSSDSLFIFDYHVDSKKKAVRIWSERYIHGKKDSNHILDTIASIDTNGTIAIALNHPNDGKKGHLLATTVSDGNHSSFEAEYAVNLKEGFASVGSFNTDGPFSAKGEMILGAISYHDSDNRKASHSLPVGYFENPEEYTDVLNDYEVIDIFKCEFGESNESLNKGD